MRSIIIVTFFLVLVALACADHTKPKQPTKEKEVKEGVHTVKKRSPQSYTSPGFGVDPGYGGQQPGLAPQPPPQGAYQGGPVTYRSGLFSGILDNLLQIMKFSAYKWGKFGLANFQWALPYGMSNFVDSIINTMRPDCS